MSIAFVVFQEHPEFIKSIGEEIKKAIGQVEGYNGNVLFKSKYTKIFKSLFVFNLKRDA